MIKLVFLVTVCLVSNKAMSTTQDLDKPYYDLENTEDLFRDFVKEYEKSYSRKEYFERLEIFKESLKNINRLNSESNGTVFAVNHFADLKPEELQQYHGFKPSKEKGVKAVLDRSVVLPASFDWRDHDVVTHVKDQKQCGSCYIFSAIGNIEGQYALKHKECLALSEQQVLHCLDRCSCDGGYPHWVTQEFARRPVGPMLEKDYPYTGSDLHTACHEDAKKVVVNVTSGQPIQIPDEDTLMQKLVELGPLSVGMATTPSLHNYSGGIFDDTDDCDISDHAVLLVGYGEESGRKYWIIKNSWGEKWGEKGYLRLLRGVNACIMGTSYTASSTVA